MKIEESIFHTNHNVFSSLLKPSEDRAWNSRGAAPSMHCLFSWKTWRNSFFLWYMYNIQTPKFIIPHLKQKSQITSFSALQTWRTGQASPRWQISGPNPEACSTASTAPSSSWSPPPIWEPGNKWAVKDTNWNWNMLLNMKTLLALAISHLDLWHDSQAWCGATAQDFTCFLGQSSSSVPASESRSSRPGQNISFSIL